MRHPVVIVAKNTFVELIRDRVLYFVIMFCLLFMVLCFALGQLSYDEIFRLSVSLGLSGIHLCFAGLTIFLGGSVFYREIEKKTIYTLLVRPISRGQYLLGKYLGLLSILVAMLIGFIGAFTFVERLLGVDLLLTTYAPFLGIILESCVLLAVTFFFSTFTKPFLTVTCTLGFFLIGHWVYNLEALSNRASATPQFKIISEAIGRSFPDLERLNWREYAILKEYVPVNEMSYGVGLALLWSVFFFVAAIYIFGRKDFE